jgi:uncharacterized protein involved in exopolysaccharide biosynthesis
LGTALSKQQLQRDLEATRAEVRMARENYAADHPTIKRLNAKVAVLENELNNSLAGAGSRQESGSASIDPLRARIQAKIASADARITSLEAQEEQLKAKLEALEAQIIQTPQVERGLKALSRDYENALKKYEEVRAKQMEAQLAESLEAEQKAERFILLEPPVVPEEPVKPNRKKIMLLGLALAVGSGAGAAFAAETMDKTIRGPAMLESMLRRHPLAVIPYIETRLDRRIRKRRRVLIVILTVFVLSVAIALVHFFYKPLDTYVLQTLERISVP